MRASNDKLGERSGSVCLIPRSAGSSSVLTTCPRVTSSSHVIQENVLRRIARDDSGTHKVLDFMPIDTARVADQCRGPNGELWYKHPWDITSLPPKLVPIAQASARHFACNYCDNETFRPIEDVAIPWPTWPATATVDDLKPDHPNSEFSNQLFLLAYRCLLQRISYYRGLIKADRYAADDQRIDDVYRNALTRRDRLNDRALGKLTLLKTKYDRRITGKGTLPMVHYVVPVEPAFPIASTAITPTANSHIATTVYPEIIELPNGKAELLHWMVISAEAGHRWSLQRPMTTLVETAQQTVGSDQDSIDWTVNRITDKGSLSTYADPDAYSVFCDQHPIAAAQIEEDIPNTIVVEYYERHVGKALHIF